MRNSIIYHRGANPVCVSFSGLMVLLIVLFLVLLVHDPLGDQLCVFYSKTNDLFADFFNLQIYIADNDVYHNLYHGLEQKNYLPLAYMILDLFNGFAPYSGMTLQDTYLSHPAIISCVLFTLGSVLLLFHALSKLVRLDATLFFILCFSSVFLFTIERGNLIILSAALAFYFLAYKDRQESGLRFFALTCLCVSVVLKGFPIVFGLYLLEKKRYLDILICVVVTLLLAFLPFLYFQHGFDNIPQFLSNVQMNNQMYDDGLYQRFGLIVLNRLFFGALHAYETVYAEVGYMVAKGTVILLSLLSILLFFKERVTWKKIMMISIIIACLPSNNGFYCALYFLPGLLLFLRDHQGRKIDWVYMVLFCVVLNPLQIAVHGIVISWILSNLAVLIIWVLLLSETISDLWISKRIIIKKYIKS